MRGFASFDYAAGSWCRQRRVVARLEATTRGVDARYIVTSLEGEPRRLYEGTYCARGQAENLIKQHRVGVSRSRIYCEMRAGPFPEPVKIGKRAVRWRVSDLDEWAASRPVAQGEIGHR